MDLNVLKNSLENILDKDEETCKKVIVDIISRINDNLAQEDVTSDVQGMLSVINQYNKEILTLSDRVRSLTHSEDISGIMKKTNYIQEIVVLLNQLLSYLTLIIGKYSSNKTVGGDKNLFKYLNILKEKQENFKSERIAWTGILRTVSFQIDSINKGNNIGSN